MNASDSRPEQEIADLARLLPVPAARDLPADRHLLLKEHLMTEIQAAHPGFGASAVPWPSVRRGTLALAAGLAVLAITVTASVLGTAARSGGAGGGGGAFGSTGVSTDPSLVLHKIASAADRGPALHPGSKHFTYLAYDIASGHGKLHRRQVWVPVSNLCNGLTIEENGGGQGTACAIAPGQRAKPDPGSLTAYPTYKLVASLPTRPGPLLARIEAASKKAWNPNLRAMLTISNVLINSIPPRKVTAALYRVAATMPGLHVVRHATDPNGRPGFGITFSSRGTRIEWIFNTKTLALTGERITVAKNTKADRQIATRAHAFTNADG
jgi:hypothetical protein